ncbi:hypothetical protein DRO24_04060 [Candidatus Bathyarchaeota archaeon]|nr:MAG: hypothetical protein DRO24_04060 [Candidatus Bathyarchaeota archaeon]
MGGSGLFLKGIKASGRFPESLDGRYRAFDLKPNSSISREIFLILVSIINTPASSGSLGRPDERARRTAERISRDEPRAVKTVDLRRKYEMGVRIRPEDRKIHARMR